MFISSAIFPSWFKILSPSTSLILVPWLFLLVRNDLIVFQNNLLSVAKLGFSLLIFFFPFYKAYCNSFFVFCKFLKILEFFFFQEDLFVIAFRIAFETCEAWFTLINFLFNGACLFNISRKILSHVSCIYVTCNMYLQLSLKKHDIIHHERYSN